LGGRKTNLPDGGVLYTWNDGKIRRIVRGVITLVTTILMVIPIVVLYFTAHGYQSLIVVAVCTAAVAMLMALATDCRNHEILTAAAT
jgi:hypothetical protein